MKPLPHYSTRSQKSKKILAILHDFLGDDLSQYTCIDVGCYEGGISLNLASHFKSITGIDVDSQAVILAAEQSKIRKNQNFTIARGQRIPFPDSSFDVVICAQIYEHTTDQQELANEIWRILPPGGLCFFSGPNRLAIMEEHYWLPFLSWLPRSFSHLYMRLFHRGKYYDAFPLYYWQIRNLWKNFTILDYTIPIIRDPHRFAMEEIIEKNKWIKYVPIWLVKRLIPFLPNYNWILIKST